jgi:DNA mismatch endonuclease (patch repair protein)
MQGNRKTNTGPEMAVRRILHAMGLRYFVHRAIEAEGVRVRPDIVFPRARVAIFVDGCFWHGCPTHGTRPRVNSTYWSAKLARNRARDERVGAALNAAGWRVVRAWEHEEARDVAVRITAVLRE